MRRLDWLRIFVWQLRAPFALDRRGHRIGRYRTLAAVEIAMPITLLLLGTVYIRLFFGAPWPAAILSGVATVLLAFVAVAVAFRGRLAGLGARVYMSNERDAVVRVAVENGVWTVSDYGEQRIGSGAAMRLAQTLIPALLADVDTRDDEVQLLAASRLHARLYRTMVTGLVEDGRTHRGAIRMRRPRASERVHTR